MRERLNGEDLEGRRVRIVQSKELKDRLVYVTQEAGQALRAYLEVRCQASPRRLWPFCVRSDRDA